jgi:hypothetical protein
MQAKIISEYYYSLKNQGRRSDLIYRAAHGEERLFYDLRDEYDLARGLNADRSFTYVGQKYQKYDVRRDVSTRYGLSGRNIARLLRINKLIDPLKNILDSGKIGTTAAVDLSYLSPTQQQHVADSIADGAKVNLKNAWRLKNMAEDVFTRDPELFVNRERIRRVLSTPDPEKQRQKEEDIEAAAMAAAKAAGAKIPGADVPEYEPIKNIDEYLKENYPQHFLAESSEASEDQHFVRTLIKFFVTVKDKLCYYFPGKYSMKTPYTEVLQRIYQGTMLYYAAVISGKITPAPEN